MNKSDGGKQCVQWDTIIPQSNPILEHCGKVQKMALPDGTQKGLECMLTEYRFDVHHMCAKCSPVCPMENNNCCMACLLSIQEDFTNQVSMLETLIQKSGHECIFLPKFHCELNPIEMVCNFCLSPLKNYRLINTMNTSIGDGLNISIAKYQSRTKGDCSEVLRCLSH